MATLPFGVRLINPFFTRYGSYTSSIVPASSPIAAAKVSSPTGPPENFSMMAYRIFLSFWSSPMESTSSKSRANFATSSVMRPSYFTCAKSRTRFRKRFASLGVQIGRASCRERVY